MKYFGKGRKEHKRMPLVHKAKGLEQATAVTGKGSGLPFPPHLEQPSGLGSNKRRWAWGHGAVGTCPSGQNVFIPGASERVELLQSLHRSIPGKCSHSKGEQRGSAFSCVMERI